MTEVSKLVNDWADTTPGAYVHKNARPILIKALAKRELDLERRARIEAIASYKKILKVEQRLNNLQVKE